MSTDRPYLGMLLMLGFCVLAPFGDALAKYAGAFVPLLWLLLARFAVQAAVLFPLGWARGTSFGLRGRVFWLMLLRTALHIAGIGVMFISLRYLPLADAVAIAFVMPFIMLLLGHLFLGEEVGTRRILACAIGFCGTLLVMQPSFVEVGWPALLPVIVAVVFALFMLVTRAIAKQTEPIALQAVSGLVATIALGVVAVLAGRNAAGLPMESWSLGILILIGLVGTIAHLLMTWALRFAPSTTLAPMQYLEIPVATLIGYLMFSDLPNRLATLGIAVTIGAGLYIILRERRLMRAAALAL